MCRHLMEFPKWTGRTEGDGFSWRSVHFSFLDAKQLVLSKCFSLQSDFWAIGAHRKYLIQMLSN